jgi:hypothetical protein
LSQFIGGLPVYLPRAAIPARRNAQVGSYRSTVMQLKHAVRTATALKQAALEHREQIINWLGVVTLLAVGVVWL